MTRKALVVGIQCYPNFYGKGKCHDLQNPSRDAEKIAQLLEKYGRFEVTRLPVTVAEGGYQVNEVGVVNARTLRDAIYELFVEPRDGKLPQTALLFFAGHGLSRSEYGEMVGYLGTSDNNPEREKWGVEFSWIAKQLINSQVPEQVIWLDCCHSGKFTQELFTQADFKNQSRKDVQRSFIAACRDSETAYGVEGHGVLSHLLLKVLQPNYHAAKHSINNLDIEAAVEREFQQHPQFKTYPQRPVFFHLGDRPIYFWEGRSTQEAVNTNAASSRQLSKQEYRHRQALLSQMGTEVESRLAQSLHHAVLLNLGKEQQPHQVQRPWDISVKVGEQRSFQLPSETSILEVFKNSAMSGKFLILGKPGGGKTTTLLELAQALVERAETDSDAPIPVILELSAWRAVTKRKFPNFWNQEKYDPSIKEWILSQLRSKGVSQEIGEQWIREKELVLLLDGLDELPSERQAKCVRAINQFLDSEFSPRHLVVCSRTEEYENYEEVLRLNGAICLEDLTIEQMRHYFASVNLEDFWESIKDSEKIVNFIRQPLFLAITSIAYQQIDVEEWRNCNSEERAINYLLGVYRVSTLERRADIDLYKSLTTQRILIWIAKALQGTLLTSRKTEYIAIIFCSFPWILLSTLFYRFSFWISHKETHGIDKILLVDYLSFSVVVVAALIISVMLFALSSLPLISLNLENNNLNNFVEKIPWFFVIVVGSFLAIFSFFLMGFIALGIILPLVFLVISTLTGLITEDLDTFYQAWLELSKKHSEFNTVKAAILGFGTTTMLLYFRNSAFVDLNDLPLLAFFNKFYEEKTDLRSFFKEFFDHLRSNILLSIFGIFIILFVTAISGLVLVKFQLLLRYTTDPLVLTSLIFWGFCLCFAFFKTRKYYFYEGRNFLFNFIVLFVFGMVTGSIYKISLGWRISLANGVTLGFIFSLLAIFWVSQIWSTYLALCLTHKIPMPWNITHFLDYCTERLILQRVGNRYRFIHRLVQEHFANLEIQKK